jgi:hypothetical protein
MDAEALRLIQGDLKKSAPTASKFTLVDIRAGKPQCHVYIIVYIIVVESQKLRDADDKEIEP